MLATLVMRAEGLDAERHGLQVFRALLRSDDHFLELHHALFLLGQQRETGCRHCHTQRHRFLVEPGHVIHPCQRDFVAFSAADSLAPPLRVALSNPVSSTHKSGQPVPGRMGRASFHSW